ncbi:hypothetical protein ACFE04_019796 [Oxalis oulophora]
MSDVEVLTPWCNHFISLRKIFAGKKGSSEPSIRAFWISWSPDPSKFTYGLSKIFTCWSWCHKWVSTFSAIGRLSIPSPKSNKVVLGTLAPCSSRDVMRLILKCHAVTLSVLDEFYLWIPSCTGSYRKVKICKFWEMELHIFALYQLELKECGGTSYAL